MNAQERERARAAAAEAAFPTPSGWSNEAHTQLFVKDQEEKVTEETTTEGTEADQESKPGEDGRFDQEYVTKLREEAAERRTTAKQLEDQLADTNATVETLRERLVSAEVERATRDVLADSDDLLKHVEGDDLLTDGQPDRDKIRAAAEQLVKDKKHLAARKAGDFYQGPRGETKPADFDLGEWMRAAAS